jgi:hypothetical protein
VRVGYDQSLVLRYGVHPRAVGKSDGVTFRLFMRDLALGTIELLLEDTCVPAAGDSPWHTRTYDLHRNSRHLLQFTFEVSAGPHGDLTFDHALWRDALIVSKEQAQALLGEK